MSTTKKISSSPHYTFFISLTLLAACTAHHPASTSPSNSAQGAQVPTETNNPDPSDDSNLHQDFSTHTDTTTHGTVMVSNTLIPGYHPTEQITSTALSVTDTQTQANTTTIETQNQKNTSTGGAQINTTNPAPTNSSSIKMSTVSHTSGETGTSTLVSDSCSEFRLDQPKKDGNPGSMQFVPVRDQGPYGICYAESANQMVDAYRFSVLKDPAIDLQSAVLATAIGLNEELNKDPFAGGQICSAVNYIKTDGYYDNYSVKKCILKDETLESVTTLANFYNSFWRDENQYRSTQAKVLSPDSLNAAWSAHFNHSLATLTQNIQDWMGLQGIPSYLKPNQAVIKDILSLPVLRFIAGIESFVCFTASTPHRVALPECAHSIYLTETPQVRIDQINSTLLKTKGLPIGIDYCFEVLIQGKKYAGLGNNNGSPLCTPVFDSNGKVIPGNGMHASLIIGRRKKGQVCQYLIRNSWGNTCKTRPSPITLPDDLKNDPALPFSFQSKIISTDIYASDWDCEKGNIWVDADVLAKSVYGVSAFLK